MSTIGRSLDPNSIIIASALIVTPVSGWIGWVYGLKLANATTLKRDVDLDSLPFKLYRSNSLVPFTVVSGLMLALLVWFALLVGLLKITGMIHQNWEGLTNPVLLLVSLILIASSWFLSVTGSVFGGVELALYVLLSESNAIGWTRGLSLFQSVLIRPWQ